MILIADTYEVLYDGLFVEVMSWRVQQYAAMFEPRKVVNQRLVDDEL